MADDWLPPMSPMPTRLAVSRLAREQRDVEQAVPGGTDFE
jgi:hypothetical protein